MGQTLLSDAVGVALALALAVAVALVLILPLNSVIATGAWRDPSTSSAQALLFAGASKQQVPRLRSVIRCAHDGTSARDDSLAECVNRKRCRREHPHTRIPLC